jgi:hypothetical protein
MKHELFIDQPSVEFKEGIKVTKDTVTEYKSEKVEQKLKDLVLETIVENEGTNGLNSFKSKSYITLTLNDGDILLFNEEKGYYMPTYPVVSIDDAISDIDSLRDIPRFKE